MVSYKIESLSLNIKLKRIKYYVSLPNITNLLFKKSIYLSYLNPKYIIFVGKAVPMAGLSPVPRDQCSTPQLDLHVMYSTFRAQPPSTSAGTDNLTLNRFFYK